MTKKKTKVIYSDGESDDDDDDAGFGKIAQRIASNAMNEDGIFDGNQDTVRIQNDRYGR